MRYYVFVSYPPTEKVPQARPEVLIGAMKVGNSGELWDISSAYRELERRLEKASGRKDIIDRQKSDTWNQVTLTNGVMFRISCMPGVPLAEALGRAVAFQA